MTEHNLEIALALQCAANNHMAQRQVYEQYAYSMMVVCSRYVANRHDAEEVLADAFCNFYKSVHSYTYTGKGSLQAWLRKIVVNQCLMHLRKRKLSFVDIDDVTAPIPVREEVMAGMTAKEIMQHVQQLSDGYRTVFNLSVFEGMSHKEIAEVLGITESTSKSQLHKAKARLQETILKHYK